MDSPLPPNLSTHGTPSAASKIDAAAEQPVRVIELVPGQHIQATVTDVAPSGAVTIGMFGARIAAFTKIPLEIGKMYDFTVAAVQPRIVLSTASRVVLPAAAHAAALGKLGAGASAVAAAVRGAIEALASPGAAPGPGDVAATPDGARAEFTRGGFGTLLASMASGATPDGEQLRAFQRLLGHDQEARVLRLHTAATRGDAPSEAAVSELRQTLKARALAFLSAADSSGEAVDPERQRAARDLVDGLSGAERDNARRAEHGAATWLPLPASPEAGVRDARMFLLHPDGAEREASGDAGAGRPFHVVLLLDMTKLGPVRVDIGVHDRAVAVDFEVVEPSAATALRASIDVLRRRFTGDGLEPGAFRIRVARERQLKIADLLSPPLPTDPEGVLDVHA